MQAPPPQSSLDEIWIDTYRWLLREQSKEWSPIRILFVNDADMITESDNASFNIATGVFILLGVQVHEEQQKYNILIRFL